MATGKNAKTNSKSNPKPKTTVTTKAPVKTSAKAKVKVKVQFEDEQTDEVKVEAKSESKAQTSATPKAKAPSKPKISVAPEPTPQLITSTKANATIPVTVQASSDLPAPVQAKTQAQTISTAPLVNEARNATWLGLPKRLALIIGGSLTLVLLAVASSIVVLHTLAANQNVTAASKIKSMYNIADVLSLRPSSTLVANQQMLQVLQPTLGKNRQTFALNSCPSANDAVVSQLHTRSIAVLVNMNNNPGSRQCTLTQIVKAYGQPNASTTLSGSLTNPTELLLYYDKGINPPGTPKPQAPVAVAVTPTTLATLPASTCAKTTYLSFVAHEDDDLLFMNPDHQNEVHSGDCLRTVFLTAGDDGLSRSYWLAREKGAEAAYDYMIGHGPSLWNERYISVTKHEYIKMATPSGHPNITLIFVELPDGNLPGSGFVRYHNESLTKLYTGVISSMHSVDGQSVYSKSDLINLLMRLMKYYHPGEVDAQTPTDQGSPVGDHADHKTTGQFAGEAYALYAQGSSIKYYTGYPISQFPQNVSGQDLTDKNAAFYAYVPHDKQVCLNPHDCAPTGPYATWMMRQYTYIPGESLAPPVLAPTPAPTPLPTPPTTGDSSSSDSGTPTGQPST